ncbi:copper resistance system multicopper oxidase [Phenylobacterium aquaticum]|uniref:copper resistance system multicopper oxidase n=1 Tax=Phenylobacterium aquaticum TaxID=1763816 RepID=UPI001F5D7167|nr:copper resistance system multicopper oxidase [Phenylobacterium aquaticum]MCI3132914.1 copper resistance system multicopper oxidase [Phenylobacterium aquaticum]
MPRLPLDRRTLLRGAGVAGAAAALDGLLPAWAQSAGMGGMMGHMAASGAVPPAGPTLVGPDIALSVGEIHFEIDGKPAHAVGMNGTVPAPLIRLREGQSARIKVTNGLDEDTSVHWHGLLLPFQMDGVPGLTFPGIKPGETFTYEFPVIQSGTYWYHSHSGLQEPMGHYGPIIIDPAGPDPIAYDREHVVMLSDFSPIHPHALMQKLKQQPGVFNFQRETVAGLLAGKDQPLKDRMEWAKMLMDPADISDLTGATFAFLINGHGPGDNWTGLFTPGERVRLRFINAAAQTIFNIRIPGLKLTVVAADGQPVRPVEVDEFQIGNAETFDVIVQAFEDKAFTLVAEAVDRSGMACGTLAPRPGMSAEVPPLRARPLATMRDMGMDMPKMAGMSGGGMDMSMLNPKNAPQVKMGPGVQSIAPMPTYRTGEPGQGLEGLDHRILVYTDLAALAPNPDTRAPSRALEIHLTGNMERFMWGFDGVSYADGPPPYPFRKGERVRVTLVNDTMMAHPIHLHGHFFELVQGTAGHMPRKHTVVVAPGGKVDFDFTAEPGDWAFHCHMLYHMHAGMFQVFAVRPFDGEAG